MVIYTFRIIEFDGNLRDVFGSKGIKVPCGWFNRLAWSVRAQVLHELPIQISQYGHLFSPRCGPSQAPGLLLGDLR